MPLQGNRYVYVIVKGYILNHQMPTIFQDNRRKKRYANAISIHPRHHVMRKSFGWLLSWNASSHASFSLSSPAPWRIADLVLWGNPLAGKLPGFVLASRFCRAPVGRGADLSCSLPAWRGWLILPALACAQTIVTPTASKILGCLWHVNRW